jgi:hypothetical protein
MFFRGSRYRNLPETVTLNAKGEWGRGKNLRLVPTVAGRITHTVFAGDRLDLLAFKYYNDTTKWWQISDANPQYPFPVTLLDDRPLVEEVFTLTHIGFATRYFALLPALRLLGTLLTWDAVSKEQHATLLQGLIGPLSEEFKSSLDSAVLAEPSFIEATVTIAYTPTPGRRQAILAELQNHQFRQLRAVAWRIGADVAAAFTFDDLAAKESWQALVEELAGTPGVLDVLSEVTDGTLRLNYNSAMLGREALRNLITAKGFAVDSTVISRVGDKIAIAPNQLV